MAVDFRSHLAQSRPVQEPAFLENHFSKLGLVEITGTGLWSADYVDAHFDALERSLQTVREEFGLARVLVNLSKAPVQSTAIADRIAYWTGRIYRDVDRVAILVDSSSLMEQMKRRVIIATFDVFISEVAARLWLYQG